MLRARLGLAQGSVETGQQKHTLPIDLSPVLGSHIVALVVSAKLHIDAHPRLIANSPKWENYEEKSRRVSAITSNETQTPNLQVKNYR